MSGMTRGNAGQIYVRCLDASNKRIDSNTDWQQERRSDDMHTGARLVSHVDTDRVRRESIHSSNHGSSTEKHVRACEDVIDQTKDHEHNMSYSAYILRKLGFSRDGQITKSEDVPYRTRTTSSEVCAPGIFRLQEIPSNAKNTIIGLQPAANQKGPAIP